MRPRTGQDWRSELERLVHPVIERCRGPVEQALHDADIGPKDIDRVVFVGGPTRIPVVRAYFEELFGRKAEMGVNPMACRRRHAAFSRSRRRSISTPTESSVFWLATRRAASPNRFASPA